MNSALTSMLHLLVSPEEVRQLDAYLCWFLPHQLCYLTTSDPCILVEGNVLVQLNLLLFVWSHCMKLGNISDASSV